MALFTKKTPEEEAAEAAQKQQERDAAEVRKRDERIEKARLSFLASPVGRARTGYERGDHVFQYVIDVQNQQAVIVPMVGGTTTQRTSDPLDILNSVCREGWELVSGSFVFVEMGSESRDKFASSGQNVAVKGRTDAYYLFRRCPENRVESEARPWITADA
jgi:hypothetical protein